MFFFLLLIIDSVGFSHKGKACTVSGGIIRIPFIRTTISPQTHSLKQLKEMTSQIALRSLKNAARESIESLMTFII